jgi:tetratricopeptide (TPR) repeat protein
MSLPYAYDNRKYSAAFFFAACFLSSLPMLCQVPARSGQISGTVAGLNGLPVVGGQVVLQSSSSRVEPRRTGTDKAGQYSFAGLSLGAYKLSASASGFRDSETKIVILTSANAIADLTLIPLDSGGADSKAGSASQKSPPAFSPAGVRGTTAPSGYSSGLSAEETANIRSSADALQTTLFNTLTGGVQVDCSQEPVLLHDVEKAPHDFAPNHALGAFYISHGDYSKGIQYLGAARSIAPADFTNSRDLAVAMIGSGHGSDAASLLEQLLLDHGSDSILLRLLAFAYRSAGETEKSIAAFHKAAASDGGIENQYDCGIGIIQLGSFSQALDLFAGATKTHSESARLWLGLGIAEHLLDHRQEAVSALLRSADADPDFLPPLALLAELSILSDQTKADLRRRIAGYLVAHPEDADAHFAYALALSKQAEPEENGNSRQEIASQLKRALQLNPRMARAHFLLGDIETKAGNLPGAIDEFVQGLKLESGNAQAHYRLSLLYRRNGQQESARQEMESFQALNGKGGDDASAGAAGTLSFAMPLIQPVPAQPGCGLKPE